MSGSSSLVPDPSSEGARPSAPRRRFLAYGLPPLLYAAGIFLFSSFPSVPGPSLFGKDKVLHFLVFGGLAALTARAARAYGASVRRAAWLGLILATVYGVSDELHQRFTPGRSSELADLLADALGAAAASLLWYRQKKASQTGAVD